MMTLRSAAFSARAVRSGCRWWLTGCWLLLVCCALPGSAVADDVPWLKDVNTPVAGAADPAAGRIDPLLVSSAGQPIHSLADWQDRRAQLRAQWLQFLGPVPEPRPPVRLEVLREERLPQLTRQLVQYESEPGLLVQGYLLRPLSHAAPGHLRPGIVGLHQTTNASIDEIAGVSGRDAMQLGLKLALRGYVVFCPRCFLWQDADSLPDAVRQHRERHPRTLGMAKMLYDAMRGVDVLESLPEVDRRRIGAIGHSLGAKEVLYLTAFDDRVQVGVASEGGLGLRATNWDADWYLGPAIREADFPLNHHQLLALIAPRPFLILGGESGRGAADGDRSWVLMQAALPVWQLYGEPTRLGLLNHRQGHTVSPESWERMAEWLDTYLAHSEQVAP